MKRSGVARRTILVDLREASIDEIIAFVFDHPTFLANPSKEWYWRKDYDLCVDPARQIGHLRDIFRNSGLLRRRFSEAQIEAGFWFMIGPGGQEYFRDHLWNSSVPWSLRKDCILSIPQLYAGAFRTPLGAISFMFWDVLAEDYRFHHRDPRTNREDRRVRQAMLLALTTQLRLRYHEAQRAALHGLHHLGHPWALARVREFADAGRRPRGLAKYAAEVLAAHAI